MNYSNIKLLIIDPQNDFCMPGASLFVKGADNDMHKLSNFIVNNAEDIKEIHISLDMHLYDDIAHPMYWVNENGKNPEPFTNITFTDLKNKVWTTSKKEDFENARNYILNLEASKKFSHTIWPYHCLAGTYGSNIFPPLYTALKKWMEVTKKSFTTHIKGMDRNSEQFGIFQAEDGSKFNNELRYEIFQGATKVLVSGQAKSHCVATSLKQILENAPKELEKTILLTDTTSNVEGCEHIADKIYEDLRSSGMQELTTEEIIISK